jgi:hypothetical protein
MYAGPYSPPDLTSSVMLPVLIMGVALAVIVYQYRRRWVSRAIVIAVVGVIAAVAVSDVWPWRFASGIEADPGPWANDVGRTTAVLEAMRLDVSEVVSRGRSTIPQKQVAARVELAGAPPEYSVTNVGIRARLVYPDGTSIQSAQSESVTLHRPPPDGAGPLQAVLGHVRLAAIAAGDSDSVPVILKVTEPEYERHGRQAGRLTATVDFHLNRFHALGALPLATGAMLRDQDDRFEILRVVRSADGCELLMRRFNVIPLWAGRSGRHLHFVLRNPGRGEATEGDEVSTSLSGMNDFGLLGVTVEMNSSGLSVSNLSLRFSGQRAKTGERPRIDHAWLDGADLVVIEAAPAGWITRTLTVDGFRMQP